MTLPSLTYRLPLALLAVVMFAVASAFGVSAQQTSGGFVTPGFTPPATVISSQPLVSAADSVMMPWPVANAIPQSYEDLMQAEYAADLASPSNIRTVVDFDPSLGFYVVRTLLGDRDVTTPFYLTQAQYNAWQNRLSMQRYLRERNSAAAKGEKDKEPFNILDMNFALGPLDKIFGPGGVSLKTQGQVTIQMGVKSNKTDNPALSLESRRHTYFDFDQKIQATVQAGVGTRMKFNMTYNTDATFDFDSKNIKLAYDGEEDDIVKQIEAGNVSMTTGSSLIRGSTALFGIKTKLQFGKLTATALISQQNSQSTSVSSKGGAQTTDFSVRADEYTAYSHPLALRSLSSFAKKSSFLCLASVESASFFISNIMDIYSVPSTS